MAMIARVIAPMITAIEHKDLEDISGGLEPELISYVKSACSEQALYY